MSINHYKEVSGVQRIPVYLYNVGNETMTKNHPSLGGVSYKECQLIVLQYNMLLAGKILYMLSH